MILPLYTALVIPLLEYCAQSGAFQYKEDTDISDVIWDTPFSGGPPGWYPQSGTGELVLSGVAEGTGLIQPEERTALERANLNLVSKYLLSQCRGHK